MAWYDDAYNSVVNWLGNNNSNTSGDLLSGIGSLLTNKDGSLNTGLISLLGSAGMQMFGGSDGVQKTGYQGGIPRYTAVRERVPSTYDPNRRPGSGGQEYFSQMRYVAPDDAATARTAAKTEAENKAASNKANPAQQVRKAAMGGLMGLPQARGFYLGGPTDGMADQIPATIGGQQPAALSDGEFVVPADVVSHLGNGNSNAGADQLYAMMDRIRQARTGTKEQGKQISPTKFMPS